MQNAPASLPADLKLPPGWTMEDMQACILAATPGKKHEHLASEAGIWNGKTTMYMPGAEPIKSECVSTITPMMDGRFIKCEMKGDMPGMGPYRGLWHLRLRQRVARSSSPRGSTITAPA